MKNYKENLILIIGMVIILGTHLVSCEKIPLPPPVVEPEELAPTLELTVTPKGIIPYGEERVILAWETTNATQVRLNNERQPSTKTGTHTIPERIFKDTTFRVQAINVKKMTEKSITIPVGDWTTSTFGLVSYYPWRYKEFRVSSLDRKILITSPATEEEKSWIIYYHTNGTVSYSHTTQIVTWVVPNDDTIIINGTTLKLQVSQEEMILSYQTTYNGETVWFDMVFEHASDVPTDPL